MDIRLKDITKIPNLLTLGRILLIPVFIIVFIWEDELIKQAVSRSNGDGYFLTALVLLLSGLTDALDGFIARRFNMITDLGKVLDPLADKLTQAAVVFCLIIRYRQIWQLIAVLFMMIVSKEITMLTVGVVFLKKGMNLGGAKWFGKAATIVFYVMLVVLIFTPNITVDIAAILISIVLAVITLSFLLYMQEYVKMYRKGKQEDDNG